MFKNDKLRQKVIDSGNRFTESRKIILSVLLSTNNHLSAEDIFFKIHKGNPNIGLTTVYRTLELLLKLGILCKFDFGDSRARYELREEYSHKEHHHHLICNRCKKIIDYSDFISEEIRLFKISESALSKKYNFLIQEHSLLFYGICDKCRKSK